MTEEIYRCEACNGIMEYDIESKQMKCPNCGSCVPIFHDEEAITEHTLTMDARRTLKPSQKSSATMECSGCGAMIEIGKDDTTSECPYCGAAYVLAQKQLDAIIPDGIIPFQFDSIRANELFCQWVKKRHFAPNKLKTLYQEDKIQSLYLPYWTFDADADADYTAAGGRNRTEYYKDREGKTQSRIVTDWYHTRGHVHDTFDDILVKAVQGEHAEFLERIEPFDTKALVSYAPQYLSGHVSQCFTVSLDSAHHTARNEMISRLTRRAEGQVLQQYDTVRNVSVRPVYKKESYKHIFVPVYSAAYHYEGKLYQVSINGQTGDISGSYPKSPLKITLLILAVLALLGLIFFGSSEEGNYEGRDTKEQYEYVCYEEYEETLEI